MKKSVVAPDEASRSDTPPDSFKTSELDITHSSSSSKPSACITHNATEPLSDITGGSLSDDVQLLLEPQKNL